MSRDDDGDPIAHNRNYAELKKRPHHKPRMSYKRVKHKPHMGYKDIRSGAEDE